MVTFSFKLIFGDSFTQKSHFNIPMAPDWMPFLDWSLIEGSLALLSRAWSWVNLGAGVRYPA